MIWYVALVLLVGVDRIVEVVLSARHARWSFAQGGREYGRAQFVPMVVLHVGLLIGCVAEAWFAQRPFLPWLGWPMFALVVLALVLRWWCIGVLGRQWNTRVIVVPGLTAVRRGPYRWLRHPNYLAVVIEGFALPLVHTAWITAVAFTVLNAVFLYAFRIPTENRALAELSEPVHARR
ncbi:isoprenylcysteine carboxyl methyltransferase family protein [Planctomonas sp. JC2975]|uniref:isoprenylcysteine carboxyl methyltransferase family protein n=1 Tax=Planctomonas sp. JC2975 TaxID=2729626 RepID=UPI001475B62E|nr:isoprenylcysteine carboxyl methyltransferase family protein [Planctomonas sp. JC2975]NNC12648.1 isoprenylcysteine carboxyl methyltransferase family protein [Planctomonas sp. JC2975]